MLIFTSYPPFKVDTTICDSIYRFMQKKSSIMHRAVKHINTLNGNIYFIKNLSSYSDLSAFLFYLIDRYISGLRQSQMLFGFVSKLRDEVCPMRILLTCGLTADCMPAISFLIRTSRSNSWTAPVPLP